MVKPRSEPHLAGIDPKRPYVQARLDENNFVSSGVVPTAELAASYLWAAEIAYSPNMQSELMVDEQLKPVDWLANGLEAIVLLPMITDGTIPISDGQVQLSGRSPDQTTVPRAGPATAVSDTS